MGGQILYKYIILHLFIHKSTLSKLALLTPVITNITQAFHCLLTHQVCIVRFGKTSAMTKLAIAEAHNHNQCL